MKLPICKQQEDEAQSWFMSEVINKSSAELRVYISRASKPPNVPMLARSAHAMHACTVSEILPNRRSRPKVIPLTTR